MNPLRSAEQSFERLTTLFFNNTGVSRLFQDNSTKKDVLLFELQSKIELQTTVDVNTIKHELSIADKLKDECKRLRDMNVVLNKLLDDSQRHNNFFSEKS